MVIDTKLNNIELKIINALLKLDENKDNKGFTIQTIVKPFLETKQTYLIKVEITKQ